MMKSRSGITGSIITILLLIGGTACKTVMPERYANYNGGRVNVDLPSTKHADTDIGIDKETSLVISLPDDTKIFLGKSRSPIDRADLSRRLEDLMKDRSEPDRMVYVAASLSNNYGTVVELMNEIRKAGLSRAALVVIRQPNDPGGFPVEIPAEPDPNQNLSNVKPNPLTLVVSVLPDLKLKLNQEDYGSVNDSAPLSTKLLELFQRRTENRAYKQGAERRTDLPESERIEKTLVIKGARSMKYGDVIKVIDEVKGAGASPMVLQIDDLAP